MKLNRFSSTEVVHYGFHQPARNGVALGTFTKREGTAVKAFWVVFTSPVN